MTTLAYVNHTNIFNVTTNAPLVAQLDGFSVFVSVVMVLNIILAITLNPLCIVALHRATGIQETTKLFMASLTVSDFFSAFFSVPFQS